MAFKDRLYDKPVIGTALRVQDRYQEDAADQLAASIGFFGFLSLFPLIVLAVAVVGFVMRATPGAELDVADTLRDAIPGLAGLAGTDLEGMVSGVADNAGSIALIGFATLLLSGLRVVNGAMVATTRVFRMARPEGVKGWLRKLGALALLGVLALAGAAAAGFAGIPIAGVPPVVRAAFGVAVTFLFDLGLFLVAYRILAAGDGPPWRHLLPGAILAAAGWTALKTAGGTLVATQASKANDLYGTLGGVIGLLLLFYLAGRLFMYGAELSAVKHPPESADEDEDGGAPTDGTLARGTDVGAAMAAAVEARDEEDPPPVPADARRSPSLSADEATPTTSEATRRRLAELDAREHETSPRQGVALALAVGALAGAVAAFKPWEQDGL